MDDVVVMPYEYDWHRHEPEPVYKVLGNELRAERVRQGLTAEELGSLLGITPQSVHNFEGGRRRVSVHLMVSVCLWLAADPVEILARVLDMMNEKERER